MTILQPKGPIILITGSDLRHQYFVRRIQSRFPVRAVFEETSHYSPAQFSHERLRESWEWFFQRRREYELKTFSETESRKTDTERFRVPQAGLNSDIFLKQLEAIQPGLIVLFDCGLIGDQLLRRFPGRFLNLHVGITSEYRGSSCHFWPIHDRRLDCLGATIHRVNAGIDAGDVLLQERIVIGSDDREQELMGKVIILGTRLMIQAIESWQQGGWNPYPLGRPGRLYRRRDFNPEAVHRLKKLVESPDWADLLARFGSQ